MKILFAVISMLIITGCSSSSDTSDNASQPMIQSADLTDSDHDGVINARDTCAETPKGAAIDNDGCPTIINRSESKNVHILFQNDSAEIAPTFHSEVRKMAEFMKSYPDTTLVLQGFASKSGKSKHNLKLSQQRAETAREALIFQGVEPHRITIVGYGENFLEQEGDSKVAEAINRRVLGTVVGYKGSIQDEWTIFSTREE
ncbi:MAG: OmpA family protein [Aliivibrio sp.]|uniref:OmpA family protein n=1 Tax=Aliivibrio sp. TaxID=1872443 RepID=UPI001A565B28|nr:OmpA family protein [Aliivibrio sp.]